MSGAAPTVAFLGLGAMGAPMAARLLEAGHRVVVWNRTAARAEPLRAAGARVAATPAEAARAADLVLGCLLDGAAVEQTYLGPDGAAEAARPGLVFVEHGTFAPSLARGIGAQLALRGARFLDAPVTGGPEGAAAGTLTTMVGGPAAALAEVAPVVSGYAARIRHVGGQGAGLELKLVNQMLVSCHVAAAAEAVALLRGREVDLEVAREVLGSGWAASAMLDRTLTRLTQDLPGPSGATLAGLIEPQRLAAELAIQAGVPLALLPEAQSLFARARDLGLGGNDLSGLAAAVIA
ncbi:NAD(P)-dependent oxidoreductase [Streptacidiphilus sp. PAMC 29251]